MVLDWHLMLLMLSKRIIVIVGLVLRLLSRSGFLRDITLKNMDIRLGEVWSRLWHIQSDVMTMQLQ